MSGSLRSEWNGTSVLLPAMIALEGRTLFCRVAGFLFASLILLTGGCDRDPLDGRSAVAAVGEIEHTMEVQLPAVQEVIGFRYGLDEQFAKIRILREDLAVLHETNPQLVSASYLSDFIDGMDPGGIEDWWVPRTIRSPFVYTAELHRRPGEIVIVVDDSAEGNVILYLYAILP